MTPGRVLAATTILMAGLVPPGSALGQGPEPREGAAPSPKPACLGTLDLHVVDVYLHEPVPGGLVTVNGKPVGMTDLQGRLVIERLCPGKLTIDVGRPDFESTPQVITFLENTSLELEIIPAVESVAIVEKVRPPEDTRSTATVSGLALERKRGLSLSEALAEVPGVSQLRAGSGMAKPIVRGHFGRRLTLLVDGVRHRAQDWGLDHAPEIDPFIAERITVVRGTAGVRYGPDAIGGVVLVDPPELPQAPGYAGEGHAVGFVNGLGGSLMGRAQAAPAALPGLALQLEGSLKRVRSPSTPDYPLNNTAESEWSIGATAAYRAGAGSYRLSYRHFDTDLGVCTCYRADSAADFFAQIERRRPVSAELYSSDFGIERPYQSVAHDLAMARGRWSIEGLGTLTATYALQHDLRREYDIVRQAVAGPQFAFRLWTQDLDAVLEHTPIHISEHDHLVGSIGVTGMLQVHDYQGLPLVPDHRAVAAGAFAIERLRTHDYELEAGLRYDFLARGASIIRRDFLRLVRSGQLAEGACGPIGATTDPIGCDSAFHTVSGTLGGLYRLSPQWTAKLDLSLASRPPNPDEQYLNGTAPTFPVFGLGRPDLGPETSTTATATVSRAGERISGELSVYGNYISDYIYFAPAVGADGRPLFDVIIRGAFPRFITRPVNAVFFGADGQVSANLMPWLEVGAQAAVVRARNLTNDTYLAFVPPDRVRAAVAASRDGVLGAERVTAALSGTFVARQSRFDPTTDLAPPPAAYFLAEATLGYETRLGDQPVRMALQGTNLLGVRYREYTSLLRYFADQPGRQIMVRITMFYDSPRQPK